MIITINGIDFELNPLTPAMDNFACCVNKIQSWCRLEGIKYIQNNDDDDDNSDEGNNSFLNLLTFFPPDIVDLKKAIKMGIRCGAIKGKKQDSDAILSFEEIDILLVYQQKQELFAKWVDTFFT